MSDEKRADLFARVTDKIIADLEGGVRSWIKPWSALHGDNVIRPLRMNGEPYRGINVMLLWSAALEAGYRTPTWMTYRQAQALGGQVRRGEHGTPVVYAKRMEIEDEEDGKLSTRHVPLLRFYTVFNAAQIDGLPIEHYAPADERPDLVARVGGCLEFVGATAACVRYGGNRAFYRETTDDIHMPPFQSFVDGESFAATLLHELIHWTKHLSRLARDFGRKRWGDEGYAMEELVAEVGAAFLCADLGITPIIREDHAAYIASWLTVLRGDKRAIFAAAGHAQRAIDWLYATHSSDSAAP
jgi:antirestriction protein ArdC